MGEGRVSECDDQRVEEGGGLRGCEVSRRSVRGYEAAVCVHVDTQSSRPDDTDHNKKKDRKVLIYRPSGILQQGVYRYNRRIMRTQLSF